MGTCGEITRQIRSHARQRSHRQVDFESFQSHLELCAQGMRWLFGHYHRVSTCVHIRLTRVSITLYNGASLVCYIFYLIIFEIQLSTQHQKNNKKGIHLDLYSCTCFSFAYTIGK